MSGLSAASRLLRAALRRITQAAEGPDAARQIETASRQARQRPQSLTQWVRANGGIRASDDRGDVADTQDTARGFARLLRADGRRIDGDLATAAWEEGFFPGAAPPTTNDFNEALRGDFYGTRRVVADPHAEAAADEAQRFLQAFRPEGNPDPVFDLTATLRRARHEPTAAANEDIPFSVLLAGGTGAGLFGSGALRDALRQRAGA